MKKGSHHTEESKALVRAAVALQKSPLIGRYGITEELYARAKELGLVWCRDCKKFLPPEFFGVSNTRKFRRCSECNRNRAQKWRESLNSETRKARADRMAKWREDNKDRPRRSPDRYGLDDKWFEDKLTEQENHCALCPSTQGHRGHLNIDHNHNTGQIRGLLCTPCNLALERIETLSNWGQKAQEYLERYHGQS